MADWTTIPDSSIEPGKPIRSIDGLALRDNPIAIAEGAAGAPRILLSAFERLTAGNVVRSRYDEQQSNSNGIYSLLAKWGMIQSGDVRITLEQRSQNASFAAEVRIVRSRVGVNTTLVTWSSFSDSFVFRSLDASVIPGDTLYVEHRSGVDSSSFPSRVRNLRLQTGGPVWWPAVADQRIE